MSETTAILTNQRSSAPNRNSERAFYDMDRKFFPLWEKISSATMISIERAWALYKAVEYVVMRKIPGDMVECGVWRGGAAMLVALTLKQMGDLKRKIWLYDTFEGMPLPSSKDNILFSGSPVAERWKKGWWACELSEVVARMRATGYPPDRVVFVEGDVCETLDQQHPEKISLLRLDTDWYDSTKKELEILYPLLEKLGVLIVDDYGHFEGARLAVDEYFSQKRGLPLFSRSDYTGRMAVKA